MKIVVLGAVGNIGKSTIAANMLYPRMNNPTFFSIETSNSGAEMDGVEVIKLKGKEYGELTDEVMRLDNSIIDVGTTNSDDFIKLMQQFSGSHEDFDFFVVPVVNDPKCFEDTIKSLRKLKALGVDKKRVRILFNQVEVDDDIESVFAPIFGAAELEKTAITNKNAVVYKNEIFHRIKTLGKPLGEISSDTTDYRAALKEAKTEDEKENCISMISLKRLAISANKNLDDAFTALLK
jgi:hypothetical protein